MYFEKSNPGVQDGAKRINIIEYIVFNRELAIWALCTCQMTK